MTYVFLETERLRLRAFTEADAEHLVALDGDPEVMRFLTGGAPTPPRRSAPAPCLASSTTTPASAPAATGRPRRSPPAPSSAGSSSAPSTTTARSS